MKCELKICGLNVEKYTSCHCVESEASGLWPSWQVEVVVVTINLLKTFQGVSLACLLLHWFHLWLHLIDCKTVDHRSLPTSNCCQGMGTDWCVHFCTHAYSVLHIYHCTWHMQATKADDLRSAYLLDYTRARPFLTLLSLHLLHFFAECFYSWIIVPVYTSFDLACIYSYPFLHSGYTN